LSLSRIPKSTLFIRDKVLGGKKAATEANMKREEIREAISSELVQEITLK
jgi:hypothetical protein